MSTIPIGIYRDLDLGTKIGADPRQKMAKGDRGKQMRRICFLCIKKSKNQKMPRIKFWTSDNLVEKWSKRPRDPHNRIRLEKLCPKVVTDRQNARRMTSKQRFWHFRLIMENPGLNVIFSPKPWGQPTPQTTIGFGQRILSRSIKWLGDPPHFILA